MPPDMLVLAPPVDTQDVWLNILSYNHAKLWPTVNTCLSPCPHSTQDNNNPTPCILGGL